MYDWVTARSELALAPRVSSGIGLSNHGGLANRGACDQRTSKSDVFNAAFLRIFELVDEGAGAPSTHLIVRQGDRGQAGKETIANTDLIVETDD